MGCKPFVPLHDMIVIQSILDPMGYRGSLGFVFRPHLNHSVHEVTLIWEVLCCRLCKPQTLGIVKLFGFVILVALEFLILSRQ